MSSSLRAIRVGVLLRDNLVEERVFVGPQPITIGQSLRCRLSIPADGLPSEHVLFAPDQGRMMLRVLPEMTGRLAQGGSIRTELRGTIAIDRGARGKLAIGDATILFQEVAAPPVSPRPQLPPSVRGTFADRIDRRLAVIVGGSLVLHIALATWAWMTDSEIERPMAARALATYEPAVIIDVPDEPPATPGDKPGAATPVKPSQTPAPIVPRVRTQPGRPALSTPDDALAFATAMSGNDESPNGTTDIRNRQPGAALDDQIRHIRDQDITIGEPRPGFRDQDRHRMGTGRDLVDDPNNQITRITVDRDEPTTRIDLRPIPDPTPPKDRPTLTAEMVLAKIKASYMTGLQRCYKKGLLGDASLAGKVGIAFTVAENGTVTDAEASGLSGEVDGCIQEQMTRWRFPQPKDTDGDATEASFAISLQLTAS